MHLDDETIQRLLEQEIHSSTGKSARDHLASCAECRARLAEARLEEAWIFEQLQRLDHPAPGISAQSVMASSRRRFPGWQRLAAGIVLAVGLSGIAYAAPGSPLPGLIDRVIGLIAPAPPRPVSPSQPEQPAQAGIAVSPGERLTIAFASGGDRDTAVVALTGDDEVTVKAVGGTATFNSEPTRLLIQHSGPPARFEISIPRNAPWVELKVGAHSLLLKRGSGVTVDVPPDGKGRYVLPLSGPRR
jgi:hypothetical protein